MRGLLALLLAGAAHGFVALFGRPAARGAPAGGHPLARPPPPREGRPLVLRPQDGWRRGAVVAALSDGEDENAQLRRPDLQIAVEEEELRREMRKMRKPKRPGDPEVPHDNST